MKKRIILASMLLGAAAIFSSALAQTIRIGTDNLDLVLQVTPEGRLHQTYLGEKLGGEADLSQLPLGEKKSIEAYLTHGMEDYFEPALHVNHADGNRSTLLTYIGHQQQTAGDGAKETLVELQDKAYGTKVVLHYLAYQAEDVVKQWTEITNGERRPVLLTEYASSLLSFDRQRYFLTEFSGDWISEATISQTELTYGKKVVDTKLGTRANMFVSPFFQLSFDRPATESEGDVLVGTLGWTGNFRFTFEVDNLGKLRVLSGINPYNSEYPLAAGQTFTTPEFIFTFSHQGRGQASRQLHRWARRYQVKQGTESRLTLLNNWEATYFDFNEQKLLGLIGEAKELGVDMFLLDDGWFGNKHPRHSDTQGLGDWQETRDKLPNGLQRLAEEAERQGVKFGLWIEPEMVNPKSELYEQHKDWVIHLPNREEYYFRNQMVLDLSNPKVQDYVFGVVDDLKTRCPGIAYFKWDCNSPITNIHSAYLKGEQNRLYIDYVHGLYKVLDRVKAKYPDLMMMMCAGGGGRTDYKGLEYFTELWPSDNTDPVDRLFIQWGYGQVFPSKVLCAHVTTWNKDASIKFRANVAMMGKMGFDIKLDDMSAEDQAYCKRTIQDYNRLKPVILDGDLYRLVSPYEGQHTASMFVAPDASQAVVFAFDIMPKNVEHLTPVRLQGLNPDATYEVREINRQDGQEAEARSYSGRYLQTFGLSLFTTGRMQSRVIELRQK